MVVHGGGLHWEPAQKAKSKARQGKADKFVMVYYHYYCGYCALTTGYWLLATLLPAFPVIIRLVGWGGMGWDGMECYGT